MKIALTTVLSAAFLVGRAPTVSGNLLNDVTIIISDLDAAGALNSTEQTLAHHTRSGLSRLIYSNMATISSSGFPAFNEAGALGDLTSAVKRLQADEPTNTAVQTDGNLALRTLTHLGNELSPAAQTKAEAAVGAVLIDFLAAKQATAAAADVRLSTSAAFADANRQINTLRGNG
jgi:hypothetical protein